MLYAPERHRPSRLQIPMAAESIHAGFPSPAENYLEGTLSLDDLLVKHPSATFFVKVAGDSMVGCGIHHGDRLVVDRSLEARPGHVIIAVVNGELLVKRLQRPKGSITLVAENPDYPDLTITEAMEFQVWGVVTAVIHPL